MRISPPCCTSQHGGEIVLIHLTTGDPKHSENAVIRHEVLLAATAGKDECMNL